MLWAMMGTLVAIWAVLAVPFVIYVILRRRKARSRSGPGFTRKVGARF